jgi:hypothetical protein
MLRGPRKGRNHDSRDILILKNQQAREFELPGFLKLFIGLALRISNVPRATRITRPV